ncbi:MULTISPECIES: transcriptional regulator FnrL [unclassified Paracoccus (in: a-proteobacteria)]|uniref:transcriptional regulator FnrL n=1 Tax=unclassified Paracoccus (in: a-proteobacteria) TaxID=2688777 RepID=UPI001C095641|nr:Crp/Fnr family transcriptional regulator [Paracoccus sp. C2R09]MBU2956431.1 Crp/Fnr family transcriptional regulator [Paracoccus sp. C2R09]
METRASSTSTGKCEDCPIRHRAVCAHCEAEELAQLEAIKFYRSFEAGQHILWEGDRMDFVASVVSGVVALTRTLEDGRTQMTGLLLASDFLGRPGRENAPCHATAATDVTLCCFRRQPFDRLMQSTPHLSHRLLEMTLDELDAAREWMLLLGRKTARERIASFIAMIARRQGGLRGAGPLHLDLPLTREAMGDYLGLTIETVSRQVGALRRDGVIVLDGLRGVTVPDPARLLAECGDERRPARQ